MNEGRDIKEEIKELGIIAIENYGVGSLDSAFAALDAIREYEKHQLNSEKTEESK